MCLIQRKEKPLTCAPLADGGHAFKDSYSRYCGKRGSRNSGVERGAASPACAKDVLFARAPL